ncbi:MAG: hypothetical protein WBY53_03695 [Acidobacteriaceae bacterium]
MKLANLTAKVKGMKLNAVKVLAAATLAGGLLMAAAPAAQAQRVVVGFHGQRAFYGGHGFYGGARVMVAPPVVGYGYAAPYYAPPVVEPAYGPVVGVGFYGRGFDRGREFDHGRGGWGRGRR